MKHYFTSLATLCLDSKSEECILRTPLMGRKKQLCLDSKSEECILYEFENKPEH